MGERKDCRERKKKMQRRRKRAERVETEIIQILRSRRSYEQRWHHDYKKKKRFKHLQAKKL